MNRHISLLQLLRHPGRAGFYSVLCLMACGMVFGDAVAQQKGAGVRLATNPRGERRVALVIGNSNYTPEIGKLKNPVNDASDIATVLRDLDFEIIGGKAHLDVNLRQMDDLVRAFGREIRRGGVGVFYFSGHGIQVKRLNYLLPLGARVEKEQDVPFEALDVDRVLSEMEAAENRLNILILDACRNNPLTRSFRSGSKGLARPESVPIGTYVAFAAKDGQVASDNGAGRNGLYTQELLKNISRPGLRLEDIFINTRREVRRLSQNAQIPVEYGSMDAPFFFIEESNAAGLRITTASPSAPIQPPLQSPPNNSSSTTNDLVLSGVQSQNSQTASLIIAAKSAESGLWREVEKINTISAYEKYLSEYPSGEFEKFAKLRLGNLKWANVSSTAQKFLKYDYVAPPSEDLLLVLKNKKFGFADPNGKEVIPAKFDDANSFSEGLAVVGMYNGQIVCDEVKELRYGYINKLGRVMIPIRYSYAFDFSQGLGGVVDGNVGFINKANKKVIPFKFDVTFMDCMWPDLSSSSFKNDLAPVLRHVMKGDVHTGDNFGFINIEGKEVIPLVYDSAQNFSEGLAAVCKDDKCGFIDEQGKTAILLQFDWVVSFSEGLAIVKQNKKWHVIDKKGKIINSSNLNYTRVGEFSHGLASVSINDKHGFIDKTGKEVIPVKYDAVWCYAFAKKGFIGVELNGQKGFVDVYGNEYFDFAR